MAASLKLQDRVHFRHMNRPARLRIGDTGVTERPSELRHPRRRCQSTDGIAAIPNRRLGVNSIWALGGQIKSDLRQHPAKN